MDSSFMGSLYLLECGSLTSQETVDHHIAAQLKRQVRFGCRSAKFRSFTVTLCVFRRTAFVGLYKTRDILAVVYRVARVRMQAEDVAELHRCAAGQGVLHNSIGVPMREGASDLYKGVPIFTSYDKSQYRCMLFAGMAIYLEASIMPTRVQLDKIQAPLHLVNPLQCPPRHVPRISIHLYTCTQRA